MSDDKWSVAGRAVWLIIGVSVIAVVVIAVAIELFLVLGQR